MRSAPFSFAWSNVLGYDVFISYRRSEASEYAERLHRDLRSSGLTVFLDRDETPGGAELTPSLRRALRRSRMLVLVLTPDVLGSAWVQEEVRIFSALRGRAIVPINIGSYLQGRDLRETTLARVPDYSWIDESIDGLRSGAPSEAVVREIAKGYSKVRVRTLSRAIIAGVMVVLTLTAAAALWQMREAQRQAEISLAGQLAAQAEALRGRDSKQLPLAATLAAESMMRVGDLQAEGTLRTALESLPILIARFPIEPAHQVAFSADGGSLLAVKEGEPLVKRYTLSGAKLPPALDCREWTVCSLELAGPYVAIARSTGTGATIQVKELVNGATRAEVTWDRAPHRLLVDRGGKLVLAIDPTGSACLWSLENRQSRGCFFAGRSDASWHFNANGRLLAAQMMREDNDGVRLDLCTVWDTETASAVDLNGDDEGQSIWAWPLSMSTTGRFVAAGKGSEVQVQDLQKTLRLSPFRHEQIVLDAMFDENDLFVITRTGRDTIRLWALGVETPDAALITTPADRGVRLDRMAGDGLGFVSTDTGFKPSISVWRLSHTDLLPQDRRRAFVERMRAYHSTDVNSFDMDRTGEKLVTLDEKGIVRLWDFRDGNLAGAPRYESVEEWEKTAHVAPAVPGPSAPSHIASPSGTHFAVITEGPGMDDPSAVLLHESSSKRELGRILHTSRVNDARFSSDGRFLASGGSDHAIRVWDVQANRQVSEIRTEIAIQKVAFAEGDRYIRALGDEDAYERTPSYLFRWRPEDLLEAVAARQIRSLGGNEWSLYLGSRRPLFASKAMAY